MASEKKKCKKVVMFPWLAHGHIFPHLELAKRILNRKSFHIYFCTTAINFNSINNFLHTNSLQNSVELVQLPLEPNPLLPPHYHTTKNLPTHLNTTLLKAFQTSRSSFSDIFTNLNPDLIIYDIFQPWAPKISLSLDIPAVHFAVIGAACRSYIHEHYICPDPTFLFPELSLKEHEKQSLDSFFDFVKAHVFDHDKDAFFVNFKLSTEIVLLKTCRGVESKYIDHVSSVTQKRILAVGPLVAADDKNNEDNSDIIDWLSKKPRNSTVYISFGSEYFLSQEEIAEIAKGLELCEANFIWVIRFPATEKVITIEEAVPRGFLERVRGRGVVTDWAPQAKILGHPSTGAFISHCGWSSLNESLYYGVPVLAMPIKLIMFVDAKMLVSAGAALEIRRGENEAYKGEEIAKAIEEVIVGKMGEGLRKRAQELSGKMRMEEGPAMDEAAEILWQLCCKNSGQ